MWTFQIRHSFCALVLICLPLSSQELPTRPHFEVATIKPTVRDQFGDPAFAKMFRDAVRNTLHGGNITTTSPGRIQLRDSPLLDLIAAAYRVSVKQVVGPSWLADEDFDIDAKVPDGASSEDLNGMMQTLLEERFTLSFHRATQNERGYLLTVKPEGAKLTPARTPGELEAPDDIELLKQETRNAINKAKTDPSRGLTVLSWPSVTATDLAARLERFTHAPVIDQTGLTGKYSVSLQISNDPGELNSSIFGAIEDLGLKLTASKVATEVIIIDNISRTPAAN